MNPFRSKLGTFNFLVAQWFFVRLQAAGVIDETTREWSHEEWQLIFWVVPVTGWWNDYHFLGLPKVRRLF